MSVEASTPLPFSKPGRYVPPEARISVYSYLPTGKYLDAHRVWVLWREMRAARVTDAKGRTRKFTSEASARRAADLEEDRLVEQLRRKRA